MSATGSSYYFTLLRGRDYTRELYVAPQGSTLVFKVDADLCSENVRLFWNYPIEKLSFERNVYCELDWTSHDLKHPLAFYDRQTKKLHLTCAGTYEFYYTLDGTDKRAHFNGRGYIVVQPHLVSACNNQPLPMTGICMQTYLAKLLGPLKTNWWKTLQVAKEAGYNFLHFTPLQDLGSSRSAYALLSRDLINPSFKCTWDDVGKFVDELNCKYGIFSITDLVLNHTANETDWLHTHPEATYNLENSPHLRSAFLIDRLFYWFNDQVCNGRWTAMGIPPEISENSHLEIIRTVLSDLIKSISIHEMYMANVEKCASAFRNQLSDVMREIQGGKQLASHLLEESGEIKLAPHPQFLRFGATVDFVDACHHLAVDFSRASWSDKDILLEYIDYMTNKYRQLLHTLNEDVKGQMNDHVGHAVRNYIENIRYRFVDGHGPRLGRVTPREPLVHSYFINLGPKQSTNLTEDEELAFHPEYSKFIMAHNGWVMGDDPLRNFAEPGCWIYQRRELIPWGDSVKLRFGNKPDDSPFLWQHMREYAEQTAKLFHGIRLDNCHSTPLALAEYVLDAARRVRPDLLVVAELFTSDEQIDNIFVNHLGISLMIREAMSASSTFELGRLVHRFGGEPVGAFFQPPERPLRPSLARSIFADMTHDNDSPLSRYSAANVLPVTAMTCVSFCAAGSSRGYDEFVPHNVNVVTETRPYMVWNEGTDDLYIGKNSCLLPARRALNKLHIWLARNRYSECFVDQKSNEVIAVTRHNPITRESCVLIARTAFVAPHCEDVISPQLAETHGLPTVEFDGEAESILVEARVCRLAHEISPPPFTPNTHVINGLAKFHVQMSENVPPSASKFVKVCNAEDGKCRIVLDHFPPGAIVVLKTKQTPLTISSIEHLATNCEKINKADAQLRAILKKLTMLDYNFLLFRCAEEDNIELGMGVYDVPGFGPFVFGGLQGMMSVLPTIRTLNDLGHPICDNLRQGNWLMDYTTARMSRRESLVGLANFLQERFQAVRSVPRFLVPAYFELVISKTYKTIVEDILSRFNANINCGPSIGRQLSLATLQFCGNNPFDKQRRFTIAAGLPHFATGYMRSWGRDTFIALPGCLLATGRFDEASYIILKFAANLQNGLIPNLLGDEGVAPRYNARDAVWWWLYSIRRFCEATGSTEILGKTVEMDGRNGNVEEPRALHALMHEALEKHSLGTNFRERNAGPQIDSLMVSAGFDVTIGVNWETGFVFGGNSSNCGTWMDKMGNSGDASNRGVPATPRDGSAVELVGLSYAVISWLATLSAAPEGKHAYPHTTIRRPTPLSTVSLVDWAKLIQSNFDRWFYVPEADFVAPYVKECFVNRRCIYKDTVGSSQPWADYQLRPNFAIALAVAPELPSRPEDAWAALDTMEKHLLGPLGVKTLDPTDYQYAPYYDPGEQSAKFQTAGGFSYHQGPEWLWPFGSYVCARLGIAKRLEKTVHHLDDSYKLGIASRFGHCLAAIMSSPWRSLPELTNADGEHCPASCPSQAWSIACFLEGVLALSDFDKK